MHRQAHLLPITHPLFNLREACKHLTLLEDHLNQPRKRCPDCIRKHFLTLEALFEEGVSLDDGTPAVMFPPAGGEVSLGVVCQFSADAMRDQSERWLDGVPPEEVAAALRAIRKEVTPLCFDLRTMTASRTVVASRYLFSHICGR